MPVNATRVPVSEQVKNLRFVLSVSDQPIVFKGIEELVDERRQRPPKSLPEIPTAESAQAPRKRNLLGIVMEIVPSLKGEFTHADVFPRVLKAGYKFNSKNPRDSVTRALSELVEMRKVKMVRKAKASKPNAYTVGP